MQPDALHIPLFAGHTDRDYRAGGLMTPAQRIHKGMHSFVATRSVPEPAALLIEEEHHSL